MLTEEQMLKLKALKNRDKMIPCFEPELLWQHGELVSRSPSGSFTMWRISPRLFVCEGGNPHKTGYWPLWPDLQFKVIVYYGVLKTDNIREQRMAVSQKLKELHCEFQIRNPKHLNAADFAWEFKITFCPFGVEELLKLDSSVLDDHIDWF
jgi:hypothetical protein